MNKNLRLIVLVCAMVGVSGGLSAMQSRQRISRQRLRRSTRASGSEAGKYTADTLVAIGEGLKAKIRGLNDIIQRLRVNPDLGVTDATLDSSLPDLVALLLNEKKKFAQALAKLGIQGDGAACFAAAEERATSSADELTSLRVALAAQAADLAERSDQIGLLRVTNESLARELGRVTELFASLAFDSDIADEEEEEEEEEEGEDTFDEDEDSSGDA